MPESEIQLPPNSTGSQLRTELGDGTNLIPTGVMQEVVSLADAVGALPGDGRARPILIHDPVLDKVLAELRRQNQLLLMIANASITPSLDMPSLDDALLS